MGLSENAIIYVKVYVRLPQSDITCLKKLSLKFKITCTFPVYSQITNFHKNITVYLNSSWGTRRRLGKARLTLQVMNTFVLTLTSTGIKEAVVWASTLHSHCNRVRMSRVSLLVVFFLAAAA